MRDVHHAYLDPLDAVWRGLARRLGLRIRRTSEVYASTDGRGELALGTSETLDADDCLAQMVFHEVCHWIVQGRDAVEAPDWRLENVGEPDLTPEHACLRLQAALSGAYGLRRFFAPTTDFRAFYDALGDDPLEAAGDPSVPMARDALERSRRAPWSPHLEAALGATEQIVRVVAEGWLEIGRSTGGAASRDAASMPPTAVPPTAVPVGGDGSARADAVGEALPLLYELYDGAMRAKTTER